MLALPFRGERGNALPADAAYRVADSVETIDRRGRADINHPQPYTAPMVDSLNTPSVCPATVVLVSLLFRKQPPPSGIEALLHPKCVTDEPDRRRRWLS